MYMYISLRKEPSNQGHLIPHCRKFCQEMIFQLPHIGKLIIQRHFPVLILFLSSLIVLVKRKFSPMEYISIYAHINYISDSIICLDKHKV